ncbi:MAG TPA: FAD-dependent oxidoreductase [Rhizomicrobium sp.]|jgi:2-polyprenyl-6-methoxyphenol hydroxylase-like FAD-dependent oxidoreductase|nr:FAD-dependent oxidoreductase [Rhizomicrobium sp.]
MTTINTTCVIAGGGPAGMMLGFLLARAGISTTVLEKHADFLRDFRGDTVHPSTLEIMHELGVLDDFLKLPHSEMSSFTMQIGRDAVTIGHFETLPTHCKFVALMPQWDFLNFLADRAKRFRSFDLRMCAEATDLITQRDRVAGLRANTPDGPLEIRAQLTIGCDGRHSTLRDRAGLASDNFGAPMDVLWFRLSRPSTDPREVIGHIEQGRMLVMLNRDDYWQCAFVIPKGGAEAVKGEGLEKFRDSITALAPFVNGRLDEIDSWDKVKLLTVTVDRLRRWWKPGLLLIGDAAHAMSPIGGVGINLAVQDAVAAANIVAEPLQRGTVTDETLAAVQKRREFPTRVIQRLQMVMQNNLIGPALTASGQPKAPLLIKMMEWPLFRRLPGRLLALGIRPEHVRTPIGK